VWTIFHSGIISSHLPNIYIEECSEIHHLSLHPCIYYTVYFHAQHHSICLFQISHIATYQNRGATSERCDFNLMITTIVGYNYDWIFWAQLYVQNLQRGNFWLNNSFWDCFLDLYCDISEKGSNYRFNFD
jgi:hypothetical protein